ncbi:hypothetical protein LSCM4_06893 [Leishmania orientalis]|uniref:Protein kinase domain-containing protein n=1 Tax=Leishmania orientalis TaxID=2249476 RepID=A0A836H931_9TRYP|nr:hypothetical protein LSCM4_06893 [Leishmania orientalis]
MRREHQDAAKVAPVASSSSPALHKPGVSAKRCAKPLSTSSEFEAATAAAVLERARGKRRSTAPSIPAQGECSAKASSSARERKGEPASPLLGALGVVNKAAAVHSPSPPPPPTSSSHLLPHAANRAGLKRRGASNFTAASTAAVPSAAVAKSQGKHSTSVSTSAKVTTPETSLSTAGASPGKSAHAGRCSLTVSATKKSGKRSSVGLHLPTLRSDKDAAAAAAKDRGRDDGKPSKGGATEMGSAAVSVTAHTFTTPAPGENSGGDVAAAAADALPPLRSLAGAESKLSHGAHSPPRSPLQKTLSSTGLHRFPSRASASHIRTPADRTSPHEFTILSPPTMIDTTLHNRKSKRGAVAVTSTDHDGAIGVQRAHCGTLKGPPHCTAAERAGGVVGSATAAKGKASSELGGVPARRVGGQVDDDEGVDGTSTEDEEGGEENTDEDDEEGEDGDTSGEDDVGTDSSSADDDRDEEDSDASASASSSSSGCSTAPTSVGARSPQRKTKSDENEQTWNSAAAVKGTTVLSSASSSAQRRGGFGPTLQPVRTKVSREGDVNVKVIFAARSRHGFRRFVKEVMSRFGFQKATDFDMYCIDQCSDRVDIDTEEDFDQLLGAFAASMATGNESLNSTSHLSASPSASMAPLSHFCRFNQSMSGCAVSAAGDGVDTGVHVHARAMSLNASQRQTSSFDAAKSFSLSPGLDAVAALPVNAVSLTEEDGKSSGSVLRLYVRYSNAYYTEHSREIEQQQQQRQYPIYPKGTLNGGGGGTHLQQRLSPSSFSVQVGLQADQFASGHISPGPTDSPFVRALRTSTTGSVGNGGGGAGDASSRDEFYAIHGRCSDQPVASPDNMSLQFSETQSSSLAKTFRLEETKLVDWRRMSVLGKGSFGTVYEGITQDGKMLAVKVQELPLDYCEDAEEVKALQTEINLMRSLKHKNIVAYYGCQTRVLPAGNQQMEVFLELCHGGSLPSLRRKLLKANEPFSISLVRSYTRQVLEGLAYLHAQNVVHRDIKGDNVLISATGEAKLADFGCSKRLGPATLQGISGALPPGEPPVVVVAAAAAARAAMYHTMVGSPFFMAPEVLQGEGSYTGAADIWSVGCLVLELLGREPWNITGNNVFQIMFRISKEKGMPSGVPRMCPGMLLRFFERCFQRDARQRSTASELLTHEWVTCPDSALEEVPTSPLSQRDLPTE